MKITDKVTIGSINPQKPDKSKSKDKADSWPADKGGETTSAVPQADQVTLSDTARTIGRLQTAAMNIPDVRADEVERAKDAINSGNYNVKGEDVADRLLKEAVTLPKH